MKCERVLRDASPEAIKRESAGETRGVASAIVMMITAPGRASN